MNITDFNTLVLNFNPQGNLLQRRFDLRKFDGDDDDVDIMGFNTLVITFAPFVYGGSSVAFVPELSASFVTIVGLISAGVFLRADRK